MAYVKRVFRKHKPATKTLSVEEREGAQASIFRLLQREQFAEEMKSLKAEKEIPKNSKILQFSPFIDQHKVHPCLGFSGRLSTIVYRVVEVQANKLRPQSPKGRSYL